MTWVRVFTPDTAPELMTVVAMLEAHDIPCFVHNEGIGSLLPGPQIHAYNTRSIMVPEERVRDAQELLRDFEAQTPPEPSPSRYPVKSAFRALLETVLFGWFVPGSRSERTADSKKAGAPPPAP